MKYSILSILILFSTSSMASSQPPVRLSVPLLEGRPAPFSGLLITEDHALQCITDSAAVDRLSVEVAARTQELSVSSSLRDLFIEEQRKRIEELSAESWWDKHGTVFMFGVGLVLGILSVSLAAGLSS